MTSIDISSASVEASALALAMNGADDAAKMLRALAHDRDVAVVASHQSKRREQALKDNTEECRKLRTALNDALNEIKALNQRNTVLEIECASATRSTFIAAGSALREAISLLPRSIEIETDVAVLTVDEIEHAISDVCGTSENANWADA